MIIECESCNTQKLSSEVKMYGKWICNDCKVIQDQEKQFVRNELDRIYKRADSLSDNYVTSRIDKIMGVLDRLWGKNESSL